MELTASTVGKGIVAMGGSSAGGYGIYALTAEGQRVDFVPEAETAEQQVTQDSSDSNSLITPSTPEPDFLFQIKNFGGDSGDYSGSGGSFGYAFGRFMLNPSGNSDLWKKERESEEHEDETSMPSSKEFKDRKSQESGESKGFQKVCEEVYKKTKTDVVNDGALWLDTWKFCSIFDRPPTTVRNSISREEGNSKNKYEGKWARSGNNPDALIDVLDSDDDNDEEKVWNHIYEKILKVNKGLDSRKDNIDSRFQAINSGKDLSAVCKVAYESSEADTATDYGNNIREYCILDASVTLSKYPTEPEN